jgi:hypothetical protein
MKSQRFLLAALCLSALATFNPAVADDPPAGKIASLQLGKVMEMEAKVSLGEANYGYVGQLGTFCATKSAKATGMIVVHNYPDTTSFGLGHTKLTYQGAKRLGNVDGYVFETEWDGKTYPSKIFFSAERVYFGGGVNGYIAADFRDGTGWAWKLLPLRRMDLVKNGTVSE